MSAVRHLILADGDFDPLTSKTANCVVRYRPEHVAAVLDRDHAGQTVQDILGYGGDIPVVASVAEGLALGANSVLIGIAPIGGKLPPEWREWIREAITGGCNVVSGLHTFLGDDPILREAAKQHHRSITDIRRPPRDLPVASGKARLVEPVVILTVGTDCNVGKMTTQMELVRGLEARGKRTRFVATGQTGIMIEGWGIGVDAVVADFVAGAAERLVLQGAEGADIVLVEGQGSLNHPGYSGVTLGLLHGSCPDAMILCHQASRQSIGDYRDEIWQPMPSLSAYVSMYESMAAVVHPSTVIAIALNTFDMDEATARDACDAASRETGRPCTDPVRFGVGVLADAVMKTNKRIEGRESRVEG